MADFKDEISPALAGALASELTAAWADFPRARLTRGLKATLEPLALMQRVELLTDRLVATLPEDFDDAARVLWRALDSPSFTGWMMLPCCAFVARAGIDEPDVALPLLAGLTPRWSSEIAIRPFIEQHPAITYEHLARWATDPDEHVRRLVSEGTRPLLPWAPRLRALVADPAPNIPLLEQLADDPSEYVRRSVGNHLNDISKHHPDLALELAERWRARGDGAAWAARHGLRTLVKKGDPRALALLGVAADADVRATSFALDRKRIRIGETVTFTVTLELAGDEPADAIIDYRVHYVGANGARAPKVFKWTRRRLAPGKQMTLERRHVFEHVSIRRIRSGRHTIDLQVNGRVLATAHLQVTE